MYLQHHFVDLVLPVPGLPDNLPCQCVHGFQLTLGEQLLIFILWAISHRTPYATRAGAVRVSPGREHRTGALPSPAPPRPSRRFLAAPAGPPARVPSRRGRRWLG